MPIRPFSGMHFCTLGREEEESGEELHPCRPDLESYHSCRWWVVGGWWVVGDRVRNYLHLHFPPQSQVSPTVAAAAAEEEEDDEVIASMCKGVACVSCACRVRV